MATETMDSGWWYDSDAWRDAGRFGNVGRLERIASAVAGGGLMVYGLRRGSWPGLALALAGGGLLYRGATGHAALSGAWGNGTARGNDTRAALSGPAGILVDESVTIDLPVPEVYRFWRNLENLPRFMGHLEAVRALDDGRSRWTAKGPAGTSVEWDAEIVNEVENEVIGWRSLEHADVVSAGSVRFAEAPGGTGTVVRVRLQYRPPAGRIGAAVASLFGEEPSQQIADDLQRLKALLEARSAARREQHTTL